MERNDEFSVSVGATLGGFSEYVKNSLVIQLPPRSKVEGQLSDEVLRNLFTKLAETIRPDDAAITSNSYLDKHGALPWEAGWLLYSSRNKSFEERESLAALVSRTHTTTHQDATQEWHCSDASCFIRTCYRPFGAVWRREFRGSILGCIDPYAVLPL